MTEHPLPDEIPVPTDAEQHAAEVVKMLTKMVPEAATPEAALNAIANAHAKLERENKMLRGALKELL
jgi:hypothetical protein